MGVYLLMASPTTRWHHSQSRPRAGAGADEDRWGAYIESEQELPMSLIFALLRESHIIFASDNRHVRGKVEGRYRDDKAWKVEPILHNRGMLGFCGNDQAEEVVASAKRSNALNKNSLQEVADGVVRICRKLYGEYQDEFRKQELAMQFLLAGFDEEEDGSKVAKTIMFLDPFSTPMYRSYGQNTDNYEVIGVPWHGAFYMMRKCAKDCTSEKDGIRLACFTLEEIGNYETRVGGSHQIYVIRPGHEVEDFSEKLQEHIDWSRGVTEQIRRLITSTE
jgi:20S proteasome alpha/beta subunit